MDPPAAAPVSVTGALPLHEFIAPPIEMVVGVVQLTVLVVGGALPVHGGIPVTLSIAVKEPDGLETFGVKVQAAGSDPPLVHVPNPAPPVQLGVPVSPPPVAPIIGMGVPEPEHTAILGPAFPNGVEDQATDLFKTLFPHGATPVMVRRSVPLPLADSPLRKQPVSEVGLFNVADPVLGNQVQVTVVPAPYMVASDVVMLVVAH
jgi:hypothetical protein